MELSLDFSFNPARKQAVTGENNKKKQQPDTNIFIY